MHARLASNSPATEDDFEFVTLSSLHPLSAGIIGISHQSWFSQCHGLKPGLHACRATTFPTEAHFQSLCVNLCPTSYKNMGH